MSAKEKSKRPTAPLIQPKPVLIQEDSIGKITANKPRQKEQSSEK